MNKIAIKFKKCLYANPPPLNDDKSDEYNKESNKNINMTSSTISRTIIRKATASSSVILPIWCKKPSQIEITSEHETTAATTTTATTMMSMKRNANINNRNQHSRTTLATFCTDPTINITARHLSLLFVVFLLIGSSFTVALPNGDGGIYANTTPLSLNSDASTRPPTLAVSTSNTTNEWLSSVSIENITNSLNNSTKTTTKKTPTTTTTTPGNYPDSIFMRFAKRFSTGNELWDGIINDCYQQPSASCFQKNVFTYLNDALDAQDLNITQRLKFYKNQFDYTDYETGNNNDTDDDDDDVNNDAYDEHVLKNEIPHTGRMASETPIEEVSNALYGKSVKFAMTHDIEMKLPETLFDGATFRISPRSFEGNGIIAKLELIPKQQIEARLFGKIIKKKIDKFVRNKLLLSFIALVLIIKIIKIKLFWLLPLIVGVGAAKKLLLKFLLFLFPALAHLFKLCSYYQQTYHSTKYHHHHHLINHHHTVVPPWHSGEHHHHHESVPEIIYTHPPKGHISTYLHGAPIHETYGPHGSLEHIEGAWENSGPGLGSEYISGINRVAQIENGANYFKPHPNDVNELHVWGLGTTQPSNKQQQQQRVPAPQQQRPPLVHVKHSTPPAPPPPQQQQQQQQQYHKQHTTSHHSFNPFLNPDKQSIFTTKLKANPSQTQTAPVSPVYMPSRNEINDITPSSLQQQQQQQLSPELAAQLKEAIRIQAEQRIIAQQQKILEHQPFVQDGQPLMPKNYDPFYSPILLKIDKIVEQLGVTEELCKERLVCSMYKDPARYSPHSNFVSAELSRDTSELQPVTNTNEAVARFYRLIQAARDGQEQRDCLTLYPQCNINTE